MRIEELTAGSGITLYINVNNKSLVFESKITDTIPKKRTAVAEAIMRDGKILSLKGNGITVDAVAAIPDEKPILFKNISVESMKMADNSYCYNLTSAKEGVPYNRRKNFRCFIGNSSPLYDKGSLTSSEVVIRDVSATGFAITCDANIKLETEQLVHVRLEDYLEETNENFTFHLYGFVVRKQELEQNRIIYGCRLTGNVGGLENYLTKKERIRIRKSRGK